MIAKKIEFFIKDLHNSEWVVCDNHLPNLRDVIEYKKSIRKIFRNPQNLYVIFTISYNTDFLKNGELDFNSEWLVSVTLDFDKNTQNYFAEIINSTEFDPTTGLFYDHGVVFCKKTGQILNSIPNKLLNKLVQSIIIK